jgi:hypothetical protein
VVDWDTAHLNVGDSQIRVRGKAAVQRHFPLAVFPAGLSLSEIEKVECHWLT